MMGLVFWREREQPAENGDERWINLRERREQKAMEFFWFCLFVLFCVGLVYVVMATPQ